MMEKVILHAELLGEAILESDVYIRMRLSEQAAMKDESASVLVAEYQEKRTQVENVLSENNMDREALSKASQELEAAEKAVDDYALLGEMREARAAFSEMMTKVNSIIKYVVTGESAETSGGCGGSCDGCKGCSGNE